MASLPETGLLIGKAVSKLPEPSCALSCTPRPEIVRRFDPGLRPSTRGCGTPASPKMVVRVAVARKLLVRPNAEAREEPGAHNLTRQTVAHPETVDTSSREGRRGSRYFTIGHPPSASGRKAWSAGMVATGA